MEEGKEDRRGGRKTGARKNGRGTTRERMGGREGKGIEIPHEAWSVSYRERKCFP